MLYKFYIMLNEKSMHVKSGRASLQRLAPEFSKLIGKNTIFKTALSNAQIAAKREEPVLILGASGTGKELLARAIHLTSRRSGKPFVEVNCSAIPDNLIESELFGYEKGAFTGARTEGKKGYFDEAHEGTLLLDEIGDASLQVQAKLLRVLEDGCFKRIGGSAMSRLMYASSHRPTETSHGSCPNKRYGKISFID